MSIKMFKKFGGLVLIFLFFFSAYFLLATKGSGKIPYDVDYFSPLAKSFIAGRLDIPNPIVKTDLSYFEGKWYLYWGPLPAILLIPGQLVVQRFFPPAYLSFIIAGLSMAVVYLILQRLRNDYLGADLTAKNMAVFLTFFAFGTSFLYIVTRSGVWDVAQTVTFLPSAVAVYILLKAKLTLKDYFAAALAISISLIGRYNIVLYAVLLFFRIIDNGRFNFGKVLKRVVVCVGPFLFFLVIFTFYNFARFHNPLDFGFTYTVFDNFDFKTVAPQGFYALYYIPRNLWYMFLEIPKLSFLRDGKIIFDWNHFGMSILFASPVFLTALLTINRQLTKISDFTSRLKIYLWIQVLVQIAVLAPFYWLGPLQVGIRYSTDFGLVLLILAVWGLRGKVNILVLLGLVMAVIINVFSLYVA